MIERSMMSLFRFTGSAMFMQALLLLAAAVVRRTNDSS